MQSWLYFIKNWLLIPSVKRALKLSNWCSKQICDFIHISKNNTLKALTSSGPAPRIVSWRRASRVPCARPSTWCRWEPPDWDSPRKGLRTQEAQEIRSVRSQLKFERESAFAYLCLHNQRTLRFPATRAAPARFHLPPASSRRRWRSASWPDCCCRPPAHTMHKTLLILWTFSTCDLSSRTWSALIMCFSMAKNQESRSALARTSNLQHLPSNETISNGKAPGGWK